MKKYFFGLVGAAAIAFVGVLVVRNVNAQPGNGPGSLVGQPAPDFSLKTVDGKDVKLSDLKGKVVLVDFWATWCPPCRRSLPHIQSLSADKEKAGKGLVVLAVNAREGKDKIDPFMAENKYSFTVPMDSAGATLGAYKVSGIPTTVVIGKDGVVRQAFVGFGGDATAKEIDAAVDSALK